mgnify:CR=1 FL=1
MIQYETYTDFSIGYGITNIKSLFARAKELGVSGLALTDKNTLSGCVKFMQESEKYPEIHPILGASITITEWQSDIILLARNKQGWYNLVKIVNRAPLASLDTLRLFKDNLLCIVGGRNSPFAKDGYTAYLRELSSIFGDSLFLSTCEIDTTDTGKIANQRVREYTESFAGRILHGNPVFYTTDRERKYKRIQLAMANKTTLKDLEINKSDYAADELFVRDDISLHLQTAESYNSSDVLKSLCERYSIAERPKLPSYNVPVGHTAETYVRQLCREGWATKLRSKVEKEPTLKEIYTERIKKELEVFEKANLCNYILIVRDIMSYCRKNNINAGLRGSAAGCLISYLIGVSSIDPVTPDPTLPYAPGRSLSFERFFNPGRLNDKNISLADVDLDVESSYRDNVIDFIRKKYVNISYITTFSRMKARSAITDIFRVLDIPQHFEVAKRICQHIVPEDKITDVLEDMREDNPDYNGIDYAIEHVPEIKPYYEEYPEAFDTAKYFAKIIRNHGRHAAGIVVCDTPITDTFPCLYDEKLGEHIAGLEMLDLEYCGGCKYDILGVAAYERIHQVWNLVNTNGVEVIIPKIHKEDLEKLRGNK